MSQNKPYFFQSYAIVVISVISLLVFKPFLPKKIFSETPIATKNVVVDSLALEAAAEEEGVAEEGNDTLQDNSRISFEAVNGIKFPTENFDD